jgi:26S proteasome regulatory subunit N7
MISNVFLTALQVIDAQFAKARHFSRIGDWTSAFSSYDDILKRPKLSTGKKIDATMEKCRIAIFMMDFKLIKSLIEESKKLIEMGGDWDRRNRLKVYEALYLIASRDLQGASSLLLDCVATFTCVELCSYQKFMSYAVLANVANLPRVSLKKKLIADPHVISVARDIPVVHAFMQSLYNCDYASFFRLLSAINDEISDDRYFGLHATYIIREYRVFAYAQFLEAYRSVTMSSMAEAFGITVELLDQELSKFIAAGRLNAKIDKVGDVIETSRPDLKNTQYQDVIKKGDVLLNHIQKLVRIVDI